MDSGSVVSDAGAVGDELGSSVGFGAFVISGALAGGSALVVGSVTDFGSVVVAGEDFFAGADDSNGSGEEVFSSTAFAVGSVVAVVVSADFLLLDSGCDAVSAEPSSDKVAASVSWASAPVLGSAATAKPGIVTAIHNVIDEITANSGLNSFLAIKRKRKNGIKAPRL
ncbi:hypothetical protein AQ436_03810 [Arthrobacter sp. EpRS66]|nr:hypothetical protein AQ436_03810 [Arthrobacter sp. EpRS66]